MRFEILKCQTVTETVLKLKVGRTVTFEDFTGKKTEVKTRQLLCAHKMDATHHRVTYYRKVPVSGGQAKKVKDGTIPGMLVLVLPDNTRLMVQRSWVKIYDKE